MLATIGYEGATQADVIGRLRQAGVRLLVDVRAVASSRRAGFSKTVLRESLEAAGIGYLHLRALGTPKEGREAARKGQIARMRAIYERHLSTPEAQEGFDRLRALAADPAAGPVALLCFEAEAAGCHRRVLAERLETLLGTPTRDL